MNSTIFPSVYCVRGAEAPTARLEPVRVLTTFKRRQHEPRSVSGRHPILTNVRSPTTDGDYQIRNRVDFGSPFFIYIRCRLTSSTCRDTTTLHYSRNLGRPSYKKSGFPYIFKTRGTPVHFSVPTGSVAQYTRPLPISNENTTMPVLRASNTSADRPPTTLSALPA